MIAIDRDARPSGHKLDERYARMIAGLARSVLSRYAAGVDLSKALRLPWWIEAALSRDDVAYPLHAALGRVLDILDGPPEIAGMEWLKAAAHARSERALARAVKGLGVSRRRGSSTDFDARIAGALIRRVTCIGLDVTMRRRQLLALGRAGLSIPEAKVRSGAGGDGFVCLLHPAGGCPATAAVVEAAGSRQDEPRR